jgi:phosphoribosylaminoimidazolecarboxamide formyltransferase/IMP cyclohydrolase
VCNRPIDKETAAEINQLFFEVLMAPGFEEEALVILKSKKNRVLLETKQFTTPEKQYRSLLNGMLEQSRDNSTEQIAQLKTVTKKAPTEQELTDLVFANKIVKHSKSNAIVLAKDGQLIASGVGQTSRVDALKQAIEKAKSFGFTLSGAVMASDAFFPFTDCIQIAADAGITSIVQPGGSIRDQDVIDEANSKSISMVITGIRHFKH